jgi:mannose-6-phosphate isomerase
MGLDELARQAGPALVGERAHRAYGGEFPLLVKLIDVSALASVQVHPNDEQAERLEGYPHGKTEAWYIISRSPSARFSLGLVPGVTAAGFREAISHGRAQDLLAEPEVRAGDCLFVPPGTVHAAGGGVLLLEVQQSSDITYRVYDWDRVDGKGNRRELHVEKALQVIDFSARPLIFRPEPASDTLSPIFSCGHFAMHEARLASAIPLPAGQECRTGTLLRGTARLAWDGAGMDLRQGDSFIVPAGSAARLEGADALLVISTIL